jgi:hypothetical protein
LAKNDVFLALRIIHQFTIPLGFLLFVEEEPLGGQVGRAFSEAVPAESLRLAHIKPTCNALVHIVGSSAPELTLPWLKSLESFLVILILGFFLML